MKHVGWWRYSCTHSVSWHEIEVNGQLHASVISCPGKEPVVPMEMGTWWAPEPVQAMERGDKSAPYKN